MSCSTCHTEGYMKNSHLNPLKQKVKYFINSNKRKVVYKKLLEGKLLNSKIIFQHKLKFSYLDYTIEIDNKSI